MCACMDEDDERRDASIGNNYSRQVSGKSCCRQSEGKRVDCVLFSIIVRVPLNDGSCDAKAIVA